MSKIKLHSPVAEMHGEFEKNSGIIMRHTQYSKLDTFIQAILRQKSKE